MDFKVVGVRFGVPGDETLDHGQGGKIQAPFPWNFALNTIWLEGRRWAVVLSRRIQGTCRSRRRSSFSAENSAFLGLPVEGRAACWGVRVGSPDDRDVLQFGPGSPFSLTQCQRAVACTDNVRR